MLFPYNNSSNSNIYFNKENRVDYKKSVRSIEVSLGIHGGVVRLSIESSTHPSRFTFFSTVLN